MQAWWPSDISSPNIFAIISEDSLSSTKVLHAYLCEAITLRNSNRLKENVKEVLTNICTHGVSVCLKLTYLNAFVRLIDENDTGDFGYNIEVILRCLQVGLYQEATQVRAASLRAVRHLLKNEQHVLTFNKIHYPVFIVRSMDINLKNEMERIQALKLVRRIMLLAPQHIVPTIGRCLVSLTNGGYEEKDRLFHAFLAVLSAPYSELHSLAKDKTRDHRETRFTASKHALLSVLRSYAGIIHFCNPNDNAGLKAVIDIMHVEQLEVRGAVLELFYELLGLPLPMWTDEPDVALAAVDPCRHRESWKLSEGFIAAEGRSVLPSLALRCPNITELHLSLLVYVLLECRLPCALVETIVTSDTFISVRAAVLLGGLLHLSHTLLPPEICYLTPPLPGLLEHASRGNHQALGALVILSRMHVMMRRQPIPSSLFLDRFRQPGSWLQSSVPLRSQMVSSKTNWLKRSSSTTPLLKESHVLSTKDVHGWNWSVICTILRSREDSIHIPHDSDHKLFIKRLVNYFIPSSNGFSRVELMSNAILARNATLAGCDLVNCLLEMQELEGTRLLNELIDDIAKQISAISTAPSAHDCLFSPRHMTTTCCQKYFLFLGQLSHSAKGTVILKSFNLLEKLETLAITTNHDCYVKLIISTLDYSREGLNRKVLSKIISTASLEQTRLYATQFLRLILRAKMTDACQWALALLVDRLVDESKLIALAALEAMHEICEDPEYLEAFFQLTVNSRAWDKWFEHLGVRGYLLFIRLYALPASFTKLPSHVEELEKWTKPGGFAENYVQLIDGEIHDSLTRRQRDENGIYMRRSTNMVLMPRDIFIPSHLIGQLVQHESGIQLIMRRNVLQRFARIIQRFRTDISNVDTVDSNSKVTKSTPRCAMDDAHFMSEESGTEDIAESTNRLETIIDSEVMETSECRTPRKADSFVEMRRKLSMDDSQRTTPERSYYREDPEQFISFDDRLLKVKSALWALGHAGTSPAGVEQLQNLGIIETITSIAESCSHYSVRATAFYTLSLISTTRIGADALTALHWPCVRYRRGDNWPVIPQNNPNTIPSPVPIQKHHRSLSDGKPELPDLTIRRTRNRSESAATDIESKRYAFPADFKERGETPSPVSSIQRLSQQDAEGYARLRSLQRHRRPSYSQSSLEMYSLDGRLSLQSLSEFESSRSWTTDNMVNTTPPPLPPAPPPQEDPNDVNYMGICLPKKLSIIFPHMPRSHSVNVPDYESSKLINSSFSNSTEENSSEYSIDQEHRDISINNEADDKIKKDILRHSQRLSNPVWHRNSRQTLLRLRQRYPEKFKDTCLFFEMAARLSSGTYRLQARRYLQELFLDAPFDVLYKEPRELLQVSVGTEENPVQTPAVELSTDTFTLSASPLKRKVNGRLTIPEAESETSVATSSELTSEIQSVDVNLKSSKSPAHDSDKLSDEKIIAEILKPAERLRTSKSSDKMLKVTSKNTAVSLE
ncbi:GSCOCG00002240001-RA-CDS [Cotesia congregata]|nr:GSCOCG00002240001-RA-CDS [Cotesia congregata]